MTFMADLDSREDRDAALHLLKDAEKRAMSRYNAVVQPQEANDSGTGELSQSLKVTCLTDEKAENQDGDDDDDDADRLNVRALANYLDECVNCRRELENIHFWGLLPPSELVGDGMVPLVSAEGNRQVIWVEEWKDSLAEKWETESFEYEGGLSAWCMRILPEPQRTRWAAFFMSQGGSGPGQSC
ncbi:predicted protein [Aspergillus nidulans FGSC A4]|uniref:Uncharacterized protein n=1 Tax=Emericella nidulans (strain FGSC A4 / ATCC 38163 / CBS 112.46 / NRRL 194 / M139) TaxID=227321 RepID=Q5BG17_EMENI|nr:hypothetical protein [Aspergillus nidulans FGSC A4]EAA66612.1 predicted protein [Aspergillus nidulans FGSC A4]CBF89333.1 TPA: conserved hypothetical protein [Aspergillus nidulans FGSC A4]|eukprot:XP_658117.1 predicted protein [Aspergillus nidulans FGSC A4]